MNINLYRIDNKIQDNTPEYQSMTDNKKSDSFLNLIKEYSRNLKEVFDPHPSPRIFQIPYENLEIIHKDEAIIGFDGAVFIDNQYSREALHKEEIEHTFHYMQNLSIRNICSIRDLKRYCKKFFFSYISIKTYKKRKILQNPSIPKILFFETAYDNMYHFLFQYYPYLLELIKYCNEHRLDYYVIMPPRCNRGSRIKQFYNGFIDEIVKMENISKNRMIFLDYQNYKVNNIYYTNFPTENPKVCLPAIKKLQQYFYTHSFAYSYERIYISRKKATKRFLINEKEIQTILENEYGFVTLYMEDYSLREKINLMMRAKVVISIDGTSLINSFLSTQNPIKAIGIRSHDMTEHMGIISSLFPNVQYLPIIASVVNEKQHDFANNIWHKSDLYLCPDYLKTKLNDYEVWSNKL